MQTASHFAIKNPLILQIKVFSQNTDTVQYVNITVFFKVWWRYRAFTFSFQDFSYRTLKQRVESFLICVSDVVSLW